MLFVCLFFLPHSSDSWWKLLSTVQMPSEQHQWLVTVQQALFSWGTNTSKDNIIASSENWVFFFFFLGALLLKHPHFSPRIWRDIMNTQTVLKVTNNRMFFFSSLSPNAPKITCVVVTFYILKTFERKHFHMQHFHPFNCRPFYTPSIGIRWNLHKLNSTLRPPVNISKDVRFFYFFISLLAFQSSQGRGRDRTPPQIDSKAPPLTELSSSTHINRVPGHQDSILLFN